MIQIIKIKFLSILILFISCSDQNIINAEYFVSEISKDLDFPFSDASIVGNIIYVSGQIGSKPGTREVVEGGIGTETIQTLNNIKMILNKLGSNTDKIFKCLCMLEDINDYSEMNNAYTTFFVAERVYHQEALLLDQGLLLELK